MGRKVINYGLLLYNALLATHLGGTWAMRLFICFCIVTMATIAIFALTLYI